MPSLQRREHSRVDRGVQALEYDFLHNVSLLVDGYFYDLVALEAGPVGSKYRIGRHHGQGRANFRANEASDGK